MVDDDEYSDIVRKRREDNWIVDGGIFCFVLQILKALMLSHAIIQWETRHVNRVSVFDSIDTNICARYIWYFFSRLLSVAISSMFMNITVRPLFD